MSIPVYYYNSLFSFILSKHFVLFVLALLLRISAAYLNYGFLALDDYYLLSTAIPVQVSQPLDWQIENIGFRSPIPKILVWYLAQVSFKMGISDPLNQIRFVYVALALFTFPTVVLVYMILKKTHGYSTALVGLTIITFYFPIPYVSSRALIENLSSPLILLAIWFLLSYERKQKIYDIYLFVFVVALASMFRFQAGVIVVVILYSIYKTRLISHYFHFLIAGILAFVFSGLPDFFLQNSFHHSLFSYFSYNIQYSSTYGTSPFWLYSILFVGLTFPPALFSRFRGFSFKEIYSPLMPALWIFLVFVFAHSIVPHKEERFMVPILPVFVLLLTPVAEWLFIKKKSWWRIVYVGLLNFPLLLVLTFYPSQDNIIGLVRFFHENHSYNHLIVFEDSLEHLPISYGYVPQAQVSKFSLTHLYSSTNSCGVVIAIREDYYKQFVKQNQEFLKRFQFSEGKVFRSSFPENLITKLTSRNKRRLPIYTYLNSPCKISSQN